MIKLDHQLISLNAHNLAIAELLMKHAVTFCKCRHGRQINDTTLRWLRNPALLAAALQPAPTGRIIDISLRRLFVQIRAVSLLHRRISARRHPRRAKTTAIKARRRQHLDMPFRQFVNKSRRHGRLPLPINPAVRGKGNGAKRLGPRDAHIGQTALLFEALDPAFIH